MRRLLQSSSLGNSSAWLHVRDLRQSAQGGSYFTYPMERLGVRNIRADVVTDVGRDYPFVECCDSQTPTDESLGLSRSPCQRGGYNPFPNTPTGYSTVGSPPVGGPCGT